MAARHFSIPCLAQTPEGVTRRYPCGVPLDVVVSDLLLPPQASESLRQLRLPYLERWIARGRTERVEAAGATAWLAQRFGLDAPIPVAAVSLAADDAPRDGTWLRADPVHLQVSSEVVALHDASVLDIHRDEAATLSAVLQQHFAADGFELVAPHPSRWYARVPEGEIPRTTPLVAAIGRNVFGLLPQGRGRVNWASAITEAQMLMSTHAVNVEREERGRPAINSVWFWGEGALPTDVRSPYAIVYADDAFARGLGKLGGARVAETPKTPDNIDMVHDDESVLVVLDTLTAPLHRGDGEAWVAAARRLDEEWFDKVTRLVERFDGVRIVLPGRQETRATSVDNASRWRWFRTRSPINAHA